MDRDEQIEAVAVALYNQRAPFWNDPWVEFAARKPDIAKIYRDNARVAVDTLAALSLTDSAALH